MNLRLIFLLAGGSWLASGLASIASRALREFSRAVLEEICHQRSAESRFTAILRDHPQAAIAAEALRATSTFAAVALAMLAYPLLPEDSFWATPSGRIAYPLACLLLLILAEVWLPATVERLFPERFLYATWPIWSTARRVMVPAVIIGRGIESLVRRLAGRAPVDAKTEEAIENEILTIVSEGHREGLLEEEARGMIEGVIDLRDATVCEIMTPRIDTATMPVGKTLKESLEFVVHAGHSRIPVYDKSRDDIVGVLYAKDLLVELARPEGDRRRQLAEIMRPPVFVPETKPVHDLLQEFQHSRNHLAVVLDEYGGVAGVVTIEDVLEEIVGEIADEYDDAHVEPIRRIDEHSAEVLARAHIDEVNEQLGISLPEERDYDTLGGFVFNELGRVPKVGESVEWQNVRITVLDVTRRRVERLRVDVLDQTPLDSN